MTITYDINYSSAHVFSTRNAYFLVTAEPGRQEHSPTEFTLAETSPNKFYEISSPELELDEIRAEGRLMRLSHPAVVRLYHEEEMWYCELPQAKVLGYGESPDEALERFYEDFFIQWDAIATERDQALAPDAIAIKNFLHSLEHKEIA